MSQAILVEEDRVVCIRFGHDHDPDCMAMDETLYGVSEKVQNFAVIYLGESLSPLPPFPLASSLSSREFFAPPNRSGSAALGAQVPRN